MEIQLHRIRVHVYLSSLHLYLFRRALSAENSFFRPRIENYNIFRSLDKKATLSAASIVYHRNFRYTRDKKYLLFVYHGLSEPIKNMFTREEEIIKKLHLNEIK